MPLSKNFKRLVLKVTPPKTTGFYLIFGLTAVVLLSSHWSAVLAAPNSGIRANLKIGVIRPQTGPMKPVGDELMGGITIALEKVRNGSDKALASAIEIIEKDDGGRSSQAELAATELINQHRVHLLIGSTSNTINHSIAEVAAKKNRLLLLPIGTDADLTAKGKNIFSLSMNETEQGAILGKFAREILGSNSAVVLEEELNPYASTIGGSFSSSFSRKGGRIEKYNYTASKEGFDSLANNLRGNEPDLIFIPSFYTSARQLAARIRNQGNRSVFLGSDGWDTQKIASAFGSGFSGNYYFTPYSVLDPHPALQKFVKSYQDRFGKKPSLAAFAGYEALNLAVFAYKNVKSNRTTPLESFLRQAKKLPSLTGPIQMSPSRTPIKAATIMMTTKDGAVFKGKVNP